MTPPCEYYFTAIYTCQNVFCLSPLTSTNCYCIIITSSITCQRGGRNLRPGLRIKLKRIEKEYKTTEFAEMVGISREYLRLIEAGKAKNPSILVMKKISELLDTPVQELFFED